MGDFVGGADDFFSFEPSWLEPKSDVEEDEGDLGKKWKAPVGSDEEVTHKPKQIKENDDHFNKMPKMNFKTSLK